MKKNLLTRLARHAATTQATGRRAFPATALAAIEATIGAGENLHRAEVRVIIEPALPLSEILSHTSARQRAIELFSLHRIWDTEENCGVLLYLNLADHKVEIVADRGVNRAIGSQEWRAICQTMTQGFAQDRYQDSLLAALTQLHALLQRHFPANGSRANQLPNAPLVL